MKLLKLQCSIQGELEHHRTCHNHCNDTILHSCALCIALTVAKFVAGTLTIFCVNLSVPQHAL
jgi:hypothetical protein